MARIVHPKATEHYSISFTSFTSLDIDNLGQKIKQTVCTQSGRGIFEPPREKTSLWDFRPGPKETSLSVVTEKG